MIARKLSLAGAVALVGVGLLANAGVSWGLAIQGYAMAEAGQSPSGFERPMSAKDLSHPTDTPPSALPMGAGCQPLTGEPLNWFGAVRELPDCLILYTGPTGPIVLSLALDMSSSFNSFCIDMNADGRPEKLIRGFDSLVADGVPRPASPLLSLQRTSFGGEILAISEHPVIDSGPFLEIAVSYPSFTVRSARADVWGWSDLDEDGDLDAVVLMSLSGQEGQFVYRLFWLENTGFEATQPLTGDLDGDGAVGASDLTMLLGGWTGH
jgi:hypothetical protein